MLDVEAAEVVLINDLSNLSEPRGSSREQLLIERISKWQPQQADSWSDEENRFAQYLQECIEADPVLKGALVLRNVHADGVEVPYEMDFLLSWTTSEGEPERIGIELSRLRSPSTFFYKVSQLLPLGRPVIFVTVGDAKILAKLEADIDRLALLNANVKVVPVTLPGRQPPVA